MNNQKSFNRHFLKRIASVVIAIVMAFSFAAVYSDRASAATYLDEITLSDIKAGSISGPTYTYSDEFVTITLSITNSLAAKPEFGAPGVYCGSNGGYSSGVILKVESKNYNMTSVEFHPYVSGVTGKAYFFHSGTGMTNVSYPSGYDLSARTWTGNAKSITLSADCDFGGKAESLVGLSGLDIAFSDMYNVDVADDIENGSVSASVDSAFAGTTITVTADPASGCILKSLTYTTDAGTTVDITSTKSFEMPSDNVVIDAEFVNPVTDVTVTPESSTIKVGETASLTAEVTPDSATDKTVTWSSSDDSIATVADDGTVTGVAPGTVTITAEANDDSGKSDTAEITVVQPVTGISVTPASSTVKPGATVSLTATVSPANATDKTVTWSSSDDSIATVDQNGVVTGVAPGTVTITVEANDGSGKSGTATVTVDKFTVSYKMNGHGTQIPEEEVDKDGKATKPSDPTAKGFKFEGWYADEELTTPFDFNTTITADTTVYAKWTEIKSSSGDSTSDNSGAVIGLILQLVSMTVVGAYLIFIRRKENA